MSENICGFNEAWVGACKNPKPCEKHDSLKCCSCGAPATHSCDETCQFVCGAPLCDNCKHATAKDGTNGMRSGEFLTGKMHIKKTEKEYKPWWLQDKEEEEVINARQYWSRNTVTFEFKCSGCRKTHEWGIRVIEFRNGEEHKEVIVCLDCLEGMIKSRFHMSNLRG